MHDRIIGALETCCRQGEMLRIQNRHVDWERHQIAIPGAHAKDCGEPAGAVRPAGPAGADPEAARAAGAERVRVRRARGRVPGVVQDRWESLLLRANGHDTTRAKKGGRVDREKLRQIDLHWHDLRHEGACRLLADGVDIRTIQLMLGHADIKQTQRYLNITDEELRKAMTGVWERRRQLRAVRAVSASEAAQGSLSRSDCQSFVSQAKTRTKDRETTVGRPTEAPQLVSRARHLRSTHEWRARQDSNLRPPA